MIPIVNHQYKYILLYSAKSGCSSLRRLYLSIHADEFSSQVKSQLDHYHNLNELFPYEINSNHSGYRSLLITRNPYDRIVSAFLDQYVYYRGEHMNVMLDKYCKGEEPKNFLEFLLFLRNVPDRERDGHFQSQNFFAHANNVIMPKRFFGRFQNSNSSPDTFYLSQFADIKNFSSAMSMHFNYVFKNHTEMLSKAKTCLANLKKSNSSFYGHENYEDASELSVKELDNIVYAPKSQDFLVKKEVVTLVNDIYAQDFRMFGYKMGKVPVKTASKEIAKVPDDLDWKMYLRLNPDLHLRPDEFYNERTVIRHFLEFGQYEEHLRAYKLEDPEGFDWRKYLSLNKDLVRAGIDTHEAALEHYLGYGVREYRRYR
ncbi:MAG: sulfotransferase family protein [Gammaproteobacteria bacterium]|nr:sulfotransferase family protein [Gammaproteobacteria bacterium]